MTTTGETLLEMAERHVREAEARVAHQEALLAELQRDGHTGETIEVGQRTLTVLRQALELTRDGLRRERKQAGLQP